jgi:hypothetical protein
MNNLYSISIEHWLDSLSNLRDFKQLLNCGRCDDDLKMLYENVIFLKMLYSYTRFPFAYRVIFFDA